LSGNGGLRQKMSDRMKRDDDGLEKLEL